MSTVKILGLAIAIAFAAFSFASAQQGNPEANQQGSNPGANAPASGDGGTHQATQKTGSAPNAHKMARNHNGHGGQGRLKHYMGRAVYSYYSDGKHCHIVHPLRGPRVTVCP